MKQLTLILVFLFSSFIMSLYGQTVEVLQDFDVAQLRMESKAGGGSGTVINMLGIEDNDPKLLRMIYEKNELTPPDGPVEFAWEVGTNVGFVTDPDFFGIGHYTFNIDFIFKEVALVVDNESMFTGIGELTPDARLHVYDVDNINDGIRVPTTIVGQFHGGQFGYGYLTVDQPSDDLMDNIARFRDDGNTSVYINRASSTYQLQVDGDALASGGVWQNSDLRQKRDIENLDFGLNGLRKLRPTSYTFDRTSELNRHLPEELQFGLIAQELETIYPNLVRENDQLTENGENAGKIKSINYTGLIPVLISSVQELDRQLSTKNNETESLKAENDQLRQRLDRLERMVEALSKE